MPYRNKQMLRDANGDLIPQYWDVAAGEFRPLTGENGANHTQVTGSNVEELQSYVDDDTFNTLSASRWRYFSNKITDAPLNLSPVDVSVFNKKAIYFENNTNHNIVNIEVYGTSAAEGSVNREDVRMFSFGVADLEEGESVFITEEEFAELKQPCIGLAMRTSRELRVDAEDSEGTVTVRFYGYGK